MMTSLSVASPSSTMEELSLKTIPDYLYYHFVNQPDREAYVFAHTDGSRTAVTFGQLYEKATRVAKAFVSLGVNSSEFIAISMRSCPEWLYALFGAILVGARPIGLSFTYTDGSDVVAMMKKLETCSLIILDPVEDVDTWKIFQRLIKRFDKTGHVESELMPYLKFLVSRQTLPDSDKVLTMGEMMNWEHQVTLPTVRPEDIVTLFQTSGSTGLPKACVHTNRSLIASVKGFFSMFGGEEPEIMFNDRPFTWVGGFPWSVITGETRVTSFGYCDAAENTVGFLMDLIKREKCDFVIALPPLLNSFMEQQDKIDHDWPVRIVGCGGQPVSKRFASCIGKLCRRFSCGYGATEFVIGCGQTVDNTNDFEEYSIGYPYKGVQMKICDDNGEPVPANQRGEIYVKSEGMFQGYFNDPEKTKAVFTEDGWFKTDDIGFVTVNGLFFCEGRKSEMIISGGMNVAPTILETVLRNCPGVASVVCVPVAHDVMYQVICACVIRGDGSDATEDKLRQYCEDIHNDKPRLFTVLPTYYLFLNEFPETSTGKTSRKELTRMAAERFVSI